MHGDILQIQDDDISNLLNVFKLSKNGVDYADCFTKLLLVTRNYD